MATSSVSGCQLVQYEGGLSNDDQDSTPARPRGSEAPRCGKQVCRRDCDSRHPGEKPDQGEVVAIGKGKILEDGKVRPLDVKVGDRILFGKYSGQAVKVEGTEYLVMREDDIMGVVAK